MTSNFKIGNPGRDFDSSELESGKLYTREFVEIHPELGPNGYKITFTELLSERWDGTWHSQIIMASHEPLNA